MSEPAISRRVCIAYPFFPHYRGPVLEELLHRGRHRYTLLGDRRSCEPTIKALDVPAGIDWVNAPVWRLGRARGVYFQPGLVRAALSDRWDTLVIHSGVWWPTTWLCAALGKMTGKRVLSWGHGWTRRERGVRGWVRKVYYKMYDSHMTYGHMAKAIYMETGWPPERVQVIYNSLDYDRQRTEREGVRPEELADLQQRVMGPGWKLPLVACVTRLIPVRRLELLIEAAALLKQEGLEVGLLLVGEGPERARIESLARERGVVCVLYGACYDESVLSRLLMMSAVLVSPGAVGLAAVHAMAYGTPVVTHDDLEGHGPEVEAVVPGKTGGFFIKGDVVSLAGAIREWVGLGGEARRAASAACIEIVERFWNASMQRRCIERCIDGLPADDLFWMKEGH